jgi:predicted DNA binding CopG/RHH family protein
VSEGLPDLRDPLYRGNSGSLLHQRLEHLGAQWPAKYSVLQYVHMSNTLTVRLPEELLERLREKSRHTGLPMGRVVRESLEAALQPDKNQVWRKYAGIIKGGPPDLSSRKGYSRK